MRKLAYLCFQVTREGQASHAHVHEIINGLKACDWQIDLFEPDFESKFRGLFNKLKSFIAIQTRLWRHADNADIIYIRFHPFGFPTLLWAQWKNIPVVQEVNGTTEDLYMAYTWTRQLKVVFEALYRWQFRLTDALISVTPEIKVWLEEEMGAKSIFIVPNGANTDLFTPNTTPYSLLPTPYALFFGALAPWQGIDTIIAAIEQPMWPEDVNLLLVGDGFERHIVNKAVQGNKKVVYIQHIPYQQMPSVIVGSLVSLSPQKGKRNIYGLYPLKIFESLACGVPVIVTNCPGQADLVREYACGVVITEDDPSALAEAVRYMYLNPSKRDDMGQRGHLAIKREHSWQKRAEDTHKILMAVINHS